MTVALTPSIRLSFFSIRAAQAAQVIPPIANSIRFGASGSGLLVVVIVWSRQLCPCPGVP
ncbi:hypothetical protein GCM10011576_05990 [Micromonospora parathelypteridis]|nr:hypothetical protein GCM10011576_05990 [Micromonospora parathelypteridis]